MHRCVSVVAVVLLAGCASAGDTARQKPTFVASTAKTDREYGNCVLGQWQAISPAAHMVEMADGFQVIVPNATTPVEELLVIRSRANGADVALHEHLSIVAMRAYRETAKACLS
ncbi:hypothetical protein [Dyella sp. C9]|uniref:hypothetical protein n=1 Tax=Dyella sp. C9 TaxID=2202154 RepID=UPI001300AA01|nr:hypothetical protein [Dyella sp. C9]